MEQYITRGPYHGRSMGTHSIQAMEATESQTQTKEPLAEFRSVRSVPRRDFYACPARSPIHIQWLRLHCTFFCI